MKRLALLACVASRRSLAPAAASAHPLGNFTINRFSRVEVSGHRLYVVYVLDLAEIPTFQAGRIDAAVVRTPHRARRRAHGRRQARGTRPVGTALAHPRGAAGLRTTRLEVLLRGPEIDGSTTCRLPRHELRRPHRLEGDRRRPERAQHERRAPCVSEEPALERRSTSRRVHATVAPTNERRRRRSRAAARCRRPTASPTPASRSSSGASTSASGSSSRRSRPRSSGAPRTRSRRDTASRSSRRTSSAARHAVARGAARADRHGDAHGRRLHARPRDARALAVRRARPALPVAEPRVRAARRLDRRLGASARAGATRARTSTAITIITTTTTTRTTRRASLAARGRRLGRTAPVPVGARRPARGDLASPRRVRAAADRRLQPRARALDHRRRPRRGAREARVRPREASTAACCARCPRSAPP